MDRIVKALQLKKAILLDELQEECTNEKLLELGTTVFRISKSEKEHLKTVRNEIEES